MAKKVGVLLSGCGVYDGAEIHEAVLTLLALDKAGANVVCMAPDVEQMHVVDHLTGEPTGEKRNVLVESARIARGEIKNLKDMTAAEIDAIILPGGFGAAKNLSDFAIKGPDASVHPEVERILKEMVAAGKPIGAICIAPGHAGQGHFRKQAGSDRRKRPEHGAKHRKDGRRARRSYRLRNPRGRKKQGGHHAGVHARSGDKGRGPPGIEKLVDQVVSMIRK